MPKTTNYMPLIPLFEKFISESKSGKRLQKNGKIVTKSTIQNYSALLLNLNNYSLKYNDKMEFNIRYKYSKRTFTRERNYYQRFYKGFTDCMFAKGCTDNYVGSIVKTLRSFFIYLNDIKGYETGNFYRQFYALREIIPVVVLNQDQFQFLIKDEEFSNSLPPHLARAKDILVFGCTVGLRFSDLISLRKRNLEKVNNSTYLVVKSKKTNTETRIKLPKYALDILRKYKGQYKTIIPYFTSFSFNLYIKKLAEMAGWTYVVGKERSKRGVRKEIKINGKSFRFCDMMSSHIMRRTAISTLLILGMPEALVRKISGHAASSREFYKYVKYSESFLDLETDKAFDKLMNVETSA